MSLPSSPPSSARASGTDAGLSLLRQLVLGYAPSDGMTLAELLDVRAGLGLVLDEAGMPLPPVEWSPRWTTDGWPSATPLYLAALSGHADAVRMLIDRGASARIGCVLGPRGQRTETPLQIAVVRGHTAVAELLMRSQKQARHSSTGTGLAALFREACQRGHLGLVRLLREHGAGIDNAHSDRYTRDTPLLAACRRGQVEVVQYLLEAGAKATAASRAGVSPLMNASMAGVPKLIALLLDNGAQDQINTADYLGWTPLLLACRGHQWAAALLLLDKGADATLRAHDDESHDDRGPLHFSCEAGCTPVVRRILEAGAPANDPAIGVGAPFCAACAGGHIGVVRLLLEHGANPTAADDSGVSSLRLALANSAWPVVELLLDRAAAGTLPGLGLRDDFFLHAACGLGRLDLVRDLIDGLPALEKISRFFFTPLMIACREGQAEVVRFLLDHAGDARDELLSACLYRGWRGKHRDWTPLHFAVAGGHAACVEILAAHGADVVPLLPLAISSAHAHMVPVLDQLVTRDVLLAPPDPSVSKPLLHLAATDADVDMVAQLLALGADVNAAAERTNRTALHDAAERFKPEVLVTLLRHGASLTTKDAYQCTAVDVAVCNTVPPAEDSARFSLSLLQDLEDRQWILEDTARPAARPFCVEKLPRRALEELFQRCDAAMLLRLSQVSPALRDAMREDWVWEQHVARRMSTCLPRTHRFYLQGLQQGRWRQAVLEGYKRKWVELLVVIMLSFLPDEHKTAVVRAASEKCLRGHPAMRCALARALEIHPTVVEAEVVVLGVETR